MEVTLDGRFRTFIVLDGIDECDDHEGRKLLQWLESYTNDSDNARKDRIRFLCFGQRTQTMSHLSAQAPQIPLENSHHRLDLRKFVEEKARQICVCFEMGSQTEDEIITRVTSIAGSESDFGRDPICRWAAKDFLTTYRHVSLRQACHGKSCRSDEPK